MLLVTANTYNGTTTLTSGILVVNNALALGTGNLVLGGGTFQANLAVTLNNPFTVTGPATVGGSNNLTFAGAGTLNSGSMLTVDNTAVTTFSQVLSGGGSLTDAGTGLLILGAGNNYTGSTTIANGTLRLGAPDAVPSVSQVTLLSGATLDLNNFNEAINVLTGQGNVTLGSGNLTIGNNTTPTTFSGQISGTGGLSKVGTATFTLAGNNTYMGATTVLAGTLLIDGSQPGSNVTVNSGAILGGLGPVGTLTAAGTVSPGGPRNLAERQCRVQRRLELCGQNQQRDGWNRLRSA